MGQDHSTKFPSIQNPTNLLHNPPSTADTGAEAPQTTASSSQRKKSCHSILDYSGPIFSSIFIHEPDKIVLGGVDGALMYYSQSSSDKCTLNGHTNDITCLALDPSLNLMASGSRDEYICLWSISQVIGDSSKSRSYPVNNLHGHELTVTALAMNQGQLFSGSRDNTVCLWDLSTGTCLNRCSIPRNLVTCVKWLPGESCVLQSSEDKHLRVWDTRTMDVVQTLLHPQCLLTSCEVSQDGRSFYTASRGPVENTATATRWDRLGGAITREYPHMSDNLNTCHFWNELSCLITASNGGSLYFWDVESGVLSSERKAYSGPIYSIDRLAVSNQNYFLCSTHKKGLQTFSLNKNDSSTPKFELQNLTSIQ